MNEKKYLFDYIQYLRDAFGYQIVLKDFARFSSSDPEIGFYVNTLQMHRMPFCVAIKKSYPMRMQCEQAGRIIQRVSKGVPYLATCPFGFSEWVLPIQYDGAVIGAVCVGGFDAMHRDNRTHIALVASRYEVDAEVLISAYNKSITCHPLQTKHLLNTCGILVDYFQMLYKAQFNAGNINPQQKYVKNSTKLQALATAISFIHTHLAEDIRLEDIAAVCHYSPSHISRLFNEHMGQNIATYTNRIRVDHARKLLMAEPCSVREVAVRCGFSEPNYFSTVFQSVTGLSPTAYLKQQQKSSKNC